MPRQKEVAKAVFIAYVFGDEDYEQECDTYEEAEQFIKDIFSSDANVYRGVIDKEFRPIKHRKRKAS